VKTKTETANGLSKQDIKYLTLIDEYLERIKGLRAEMKHSKTEINRLKAASRRKLAEIDAILKAC
jgi:hypothetical protein